MSGCGTWCTCLVATCISGYMHMHASIGQIFLSTINNQKDVFFVYYKQSKGCILCTVNNQKDVFCVL